jgi:hypothetical protein
MSRILRQAFLDVCNGYSVCSLNGTNLYIKHLSHKEHLFLDDLYEKFREEAIANGLQSEQDRLKYIIAEGLWTEKREFEIVQKRDYIKRLNEGKKLINYPSILERHNKDIEVETNKLYKIELERLDLIGVTCESYANKVISDYYILRSIFKDADCKIPYLTEQEFDEIDDEILTELIGAYRTAGETCSDSNLKKLAIQDFYTPYFYLCADNISSFFGKSICDLTYNQVKLANFSKYFKALLENVDIKTLPKKAAEDPDELVNYLTVTKNAKGVIDKNQHANVALVGANKNDIAAITGKEQNSLPAKPMSMKEMIELEKKRGR